MRRFFTITAMGLAFFWAQEPSASAVSLSMGNSVSTNGGDVTVATIRTDIDLLSPASATGTVDTATFGWSASGCINTVKIKFFRRSGDTLTMTAERGPFGTLSSNTVALSPAVSVQQGDLIGIARVADCGNAEVQAGVLPVGYVAYSGDVTGSVSFTAGSHQGSSLDVQATGSATESVSRIIPVAISSPGAFGSFFKTAVQVSNSIPGGESITGRFVFHPSGVSGNSSDPSLPISVNSGQTISFTDIVAAMGQSGVGTMDLVLPTGVQVPVVVVRVYNDGGAAGTTGFTEDLVDPSGPFFGPTLSTGIIGYILGPSDTAHFRYNIGVRSLFVGAQLTVTARDADGVIIASNSVTYPPTFLQQVDATSFLGVPITNDDSIEITVSRGAAIVYGATADNITNDPSLQYGRGVSAVLSKSPPTR